MVTFNPLGIAVSSNNGDSASMTWPQLGVGLAIITAVVAVSLSFGDLRTAIALISNRQDQTLLEVRDIRSLTQSNRERMDIMDRRLALFADRIFVLEQKIRKRDKV
jgi:hypothetical protein